MTESTQFSLDTRLADTGIELIQTNHYVLNLANDSRYIWLILIPKIADITELYQLSETQQCNLMTLSCNIGKALMDRYQGDKLNVAAIGNIVNQLHLHHVVRYKTDSAWPGPIWGVGETIPYSDSLLGERKEELEEICRFVQRAS